MVCGNAVPLSNPRHVVQYLRDHVADGLANELRGLNEDNAVAALRHIEYRLADALQLVRLCQCAQSEEEAGDGDDAG
jgi:hypothetical protein